MASRGWEISSTWEVDGGAGAALSNHVTVRDVHSGDGSGVPENACIRLVPGPEKQSCEVTVRFQVQQHAIHCIDVLSTARVCEVYRQSEGDTDAEYLCTARGQLETGGGIRACEVALQSRNGVGGSRFVRCGDCPIAFSSR